MYLKAWGKVSGNGVKIDSALLKSVRGEFGLGVRTPRFYQICAAAVSDMFKRSGLTAQELSRECGIIVASRLGPVAMVSKFQDELLDYPEDQVMAGNFANSVHNAPAGAVTVMLDVRGPAFSVMGFEDMIPQAIELAEMTLSSGNAPEMLLITAEEETVIGESVRMVHSSFEHEAAAVYLLTVDDKYPEFDINAIK